MTDEKICPFMSRPVFEPPHESHWTAGMMMEGQVKYVFVPCQRERCMAWSNNEYPNGHCQLIRKGDR
jgi:hypothetical protein